MANLRLELKDRILLLGAPRAVLAKCIGCYSSDLSAYLNQGAQLSRPKIELLRTLVEALEVCLPLFPIKPDLRDPENIRTLLTEAAKIVASCESKETLIARVEINRIAVETQEFIRIVDEGLNLALSTN